MTIEQTVGEFVRAALKESEQQLVTFAAEAVQDSSAAVQRFGSIAQSRADEATAAMKRLLQNLPSG